MALELPRARQDMTGSRFDGKRSGRPKKYIYYKTLRIN